MYITKGGSVFPIPQSSYSYVTSYMYLLELSEAIEKSSN